MLDRVEMRWTGVNVAILSPDVAGVTATYEQRTMMSNGTPWNTNGVWTGMLVRADAGWRIVRVYQATLP